LFYAHNIGRHDEYILNMERALFGLKHKVWMKQLWIKVSVGKNKWLAWRY
jgi:hypothetical protein